jgi:hypothetical protein
LRGKITLSTILQIVDKVLFPFVPLKIVPLLAAIEAVGETKQDCSDDLPILHRFTGGSLAMMPVNCIRHERRECVGQAIAGRQVLESIFQDRYVENAL